MEQTSSRATAPVPLPEPPAHGLVHGVLYAIAALWPFARATQLEWVVGPRGDRWLARGVGITVAVLGGVLGHAGGRDGTGSHRLATFGVAAGLAALDTVCALARCAGAVPWRARTLDELPLVMTWFSSQPATH